MAQSKKKDSQPNAVGHAMIGDSLGAPVLQCNLIEEIEGLHKEPAWMQGTGPSSKTLVKHRDLRIVLLALRQKMTMPEHKTSATISVQTLAGHIRMKLPGRTVDLPAGHLLVLDHLVPHNVEAEEDSAFLLTLSSPSEEADKGGASQKK